MLPALWWTAWLLGSGARVRHPTGAGQIIQALTPGTWSPALIPLAIAALTLIAIICTVSYGPVGSPVPMTPDGTHHGTPD
jgi:hypothetical protein